MDPRQFLAQTRAGLGNAPTVITANSHRLLGGHGFGISNEESSRDSLRPLSNAAPAMSPAIQQLSQFYNSLGSHGGWTSDEDKLLLLGVATSGVGKWTEIRDDFMMKRNSAQMNQRFARLAGRRSVYVDINEPDKYDKGDDQAGSKAPTPATATPNLQDDYKTVRTRFMSADEEKQARCKLSPNVKQMLEEFSEDKIWECIAIRHLHDTQSKGKKCGRPQKYPLPIPIPKYMQKGAWVNHRHLLIERPGSFTPTENTQSSSTAAAAVKREDEDNEQKDAEPVDEVANILDSDTLIEEPQIPPVVRAKRLNTKMSLVQSSEGYPEKKRSRVAEASDALKEQQEHLLQGQNEASQHRVDPSSTSSIYPNASGLDYLSYSAPLEPPIQTQMLHDDGLLLPPQPPAFLYQTSPPPPGNNAYSLAMGSYQHSLAPLGYQDVYRSEM